MKFLVVVISALFVGLSSVPAFAEYKCGPVVKVDLVPVVEANGRIDAEYCIYSDASADSDNYLGCVGKDDILFLDIIGLAIGTGKRVCIEERTFVIEGEEYRKTASIFYERES